MKNRFFQYLSLTLLFSMPVVVSAQILGGSNNTDSRIKPTIGIKIGANLSNVYDTQGDEFQADSKIGLAAGAFINIPITQYMGLQPEILYSQKGYQGSGTVLGSDYSFKRSMNYIDVPLLFALRTGEYLTVLFGPQYSFLLNQHYTFNSDLINISQDEQFDNENLLKNTLCMTGGFDLTLANILLGARLGWDLLSNKGDGTSSTPRYKNIWYQATVGFRL